MHYEHKSEDTHKVTNTCNYNRWAAREILCDKNYMEVKM